jgi:hypothetical protein
MVCKYMVLNAIPKNRIIAVGFSCFVRQIFKSKIDEPIKKSYVGYFVLSSLLAQVHTNYDVAWVVLLSIII